MSRALSRLVLKQNEDDIAGLLEPQERALILVDFFVAPGRRRHRSASEPPNGRPGMPTVGMGALAFAATVLMGESPFGPPSLGRRLGGTSSTGHAGSWAERLMSAERDARRFSTDLLVTDRRVLLVGSPINLIGHTRFERVFEMPRDAIRCASRKGRPFARGRVVLEFSDGSMIALKLGTVAAREADDLVTVLGSSTSAAVA